MARFQMELPTDLIKDIDNLEKNSQKMFGEMTKAGAETVEKIMERNAPSELKSHIKVSVTYRTPSDNGINTKVYIGGYIPFSNPNRKYFSRNGGSGKNYKSSDGVPAAFLAQLYEYGRSNGNPFPKKPFMRKSFRKKEIEAAMLQAQVKASGGLLDE